MAMLVCGANSEGFITAQLPAAIALSRGLIKRHTGKFHAE